MSEPAPASRNLILGWAKETENGGPDNRARALKIASRDGIGAEWVNQLFDEADEAKKRAQLDAEQRSAALQAIILNGRKIREQAAKAKLPEAVVETAKSVEAAPIVTRRSVGMEAVAQPPSVKAVLGTPQAALAAGKAEPVAEVPVLAPLTPQPLSAAAAAMKPGPLVTRREAAKPVEPPPPKPEEVAEGSATEGVEAAVAAVERLELKPGTELIVAPNHLPAIASAAARLKDMNDKHAVIGNLGGKCVIMEWVPNKAVPGSTDLSYQTFASFKERYSADYVHTADEMGRPVSKLAGQYWLSHSRRRQYEGLDLVPNGPPVLPGNYLNLWRGWGLEPKPGPWPRLQRHIDEILANGDARFAEYIRRWAAWIVQHPGVPPEVALVLRGGKGSGKGPGAMP